MVTFITSVLTYKDRGRPDVQLCICIHRMELSHWFYIHRQIMFEGSTHLSRIGDPIVFSCIKH